jgi:hypothetical protein
MQTNVACRCLSHPHVILSSSPGFMSRDFYLKSKLCVKPKLGRLINHLCKRLWGCRTWHAKLTRANLSEYMHKTSYSVPRYYPGFEWVDGLSYMPGTEWDHSKFEPCLMVLSKIAFRVSIPRHSSELPDPNQAIASFTSEPWAAEHHRRKRRYIRHHSGLSQPLDKAADVDRMTEHQFNLLMQLSNLSKNRVTGEDKLKTRHANSLLPHRAGSVHSQSEPQIIKIWGIT